MLKWGNFCIWHSNETSFPWRSWKIVPHFIDRDNWVSHTKDHVCIGLLSLSLWKFKNELGDEHKTLAFILYAMVQNHNQDWIIPV